MQQVSSHRADTPNRFHVRPSAAGHLAIIEFPDPGLADHLVAGVPAAARLVRITREAGYTACAMVLPDGKQPAPFTRDEIARLGGDLPVSVIDGCEAEAYIQAGAVRTDGTTVADTEARSRQPALNGLDPIMARKRLDQWGKEILRATAKPSDGIVSRTINRPISQTISALLLRVPGVLPLHVTWSTAVLAVTMAAVLVLGGASGLLPGAILFQAASIIDGVDGEIARATFRESAAGARLDSLVDAATNLAFIAGVAINLFLQGDRMSAWAGGIGLAAFAAGLVLIARRSRQREAGLTFNAVKEHFRQKPTWLMTFLTWLTMRDFFALAFAAFIAAGLSAFAMKAFLVIVCGWLLVVLWVMHRQT